MTPSRPMRGVALILVLWLVAGLSLVVVAGSRSVSAHVRLVSLELERERAEALLDGAISLLARHVRAQPNTGNAYRRYRLTIADQEVTVEITPSKGLVDVNIATPELLQELLTKIGGLSSDESTVLASRIRDWIDPDDQPSGVGGAESAQYRAANWPSLPRNARIDDVQDLLSVMGLTPEVYERISPFIGINGTSRIDVGAAPPALMDRMIGQPGIGEQFHGLPLDRREAAAAAFTVQPWFDHRPSQTETMLRITASLQGEESRVWQRQVWIDSNERPDTLTPWTTLTVEPTRRVRAINSVPE